MRILLVNVHFDPESFGGATIVVEQTASQLAEQGHEVVVLTGIMEPRLPHGHFYRYEARGLPVVALGRAIPDSVGAEYSQPSQAEQFQRVLDAVQPDVVHFHAIQGLGVELVEQTQQAGIPTVVTLHDAWWFCQRQFMVTAEGKWCGQTGIDPRVCAGCIPDPAAHEHRQARSKTILDACGRVLTPSAYWASVMVGSGVAADRVQVNRNGVQHPRPGFRRTPYDGVIRFGYVGGDTPIKGARLIRAALNDLPRSDYALRLVDASLNLGHQSLYPQDWEYPGLVQIVPGYTHSGLDDFFDSIDVLLFPSQWRESYGLTVREAVLRGVWVIASEGGGTSEDLVDGVNATLPPMGDSAALRAAMLAAMDAPRAFRDRARTVRPIPTFADQARELAEIYASL